MDAQSITNIVIGAGSMVATICSVIVAWVAFQISRKSSEEAARKKQEMSEAAARKEQANLVAELEKDYIQVRKQTRAYRKVAKRFLQMFLEAGEKVEGVESPKVTLAVAKKWWATEKRLADTVHSTITLSDKDLLDIENALDELSCYWDRVVSAADNKLLPDSFFNAGGEWAKRAKKFMITMEPLDAAQWYILGLHWQGKYNKTNEHGKFIFRPKRHIYLEECVLRDAMKDFQGKFAEFVNEFPDSEFIPRPEEQNGTGASPVIVTIENGS